MNQPIRVLSLDDDIDFSMILKIKLKAPLFTLTTVNTPETFLKELKDKKFDLILLDRHLGPNQPMGIHLLEILRNKLNIHTPVVMVSHHDDYQGIQDCLEVGADDYVTKPLDEVLLKSKIQYLINSKNQELDELHIGRVPGQLGKAGVVSVAEIIEINELGIRLSSPFFVRKGALIRISSPLLQEITAQESLMMNVATSELKHGSHYNMSLEFDADDKALLSAVRTWLS